MKNLYLIILALLAFLPTVAAAEDTSLPLTRGSIIRNTARITFEWPEPVRFSAKANGKTLTITFDRNANPDFGAMLSELYPYVTSAGRKDDGRTIVFTLEKPYRVRTFISDTVSGVELLSIDPAERASLLAGSPAPAAASEKAPALAALAPSAGEEATKPAVPIGPPPPAQEPAVAKPTAIAAATPQPLSAAKDEKAIATPPTPIAKEETAMATPPAPSVAKNDGQATPPQEEAKLAAAMPPSGPVKVGVSPAEDSAVLRFHFTERVAAAVFARANTLWIVFNKPVKLDLSDFDSLPQTVIGKAKLLPDTAATILRVPMDDTMYATVAREEGSFEWAVLVTPRKPAIAKPLKVEVHTDPPAPSNVFIPVLEMADPVAIDDPAIGDSLTVVPLYNPGEAVAMRREFVEFSLLKTSQGIAVARKADDVAVESIRNGLRIAMPEGMTLTPGLPDVKPAAASSETLESSPTLFPYKLWRADDSLPQRQQEQELMRRIVESGTAQESNNARQRLAQIYLSEGLAPEALGLLAGIERTNPVYFRSANLAAMRGAADFLMYRFSDAARDFAASELNNNKEADYWRNMIADLLGNPAQYNYLEMNKDYISQYPPLFRQRLAIVAADRAITSKEYNTALKIFDTLRDNNLIDPVQSYVSFLMAKISADTGQEKEAGDSWDKLAEDYEHPFVRARAEFSRIVWGMDHSTLNKDQVIDRLERLRLAWHGDGLEMQALKLLGDLYAERKDYVNAMRIWNDGVTSFPDTAAAIDMSHKMEEAFVTMFNEGGADSLPTLDALTIYYEYRDYAPTGATGDQMIDRLADRLVSVDLLDQAALLLDHQMRFQAEKEKRSHIGARLATVYLLNHQPKRALEALENSVYGENAATLRLLRNRLTAEALSELDDPDKALQILGSDNSPDAERARLNIYWQQRDWPHVIATAEGMLRERKDITAPLTIDESESVLKLALAYEFQNDPVQLQYLRDYFGPLMAKNPNKAIFDFVTAADVAPTPTNFDEVLDNLSAAQSFVDRYKARIQTAGLDTMAKKSAPAQAQP